MKNDNIVGGGRKTLLMAAIAVVGALVAYGAQRSLSGLESVLDQNDSTNGGFWDVSERDSFTVFDGSATVPKAVDASAGVTATGGSMSDLDVRAFSFGESGEISLRTDVPIGLYIYVR